MGLRMNRESYKICKNLTSLLSIFAVSSRDLFAYLPLLTAQYGKYMKFLEESHFSLQFKSYRRNR